MNTGSAADDVLDEHPQRAVTWTTVNAAEAAFPDVPTPLSWSWSWWPTESGIRGCFAGTGAFPRTFARPPTDLADRILTIHQGHVAINLDLFRELRVAAELARDRDRDVRDSALVAGGGTIDVNGNNITYAGSIGNNGPGTLTVKSSLAGGSLTLSGANTYTGNTTVNDGTLEIEQPYLATNSTVTVATGATLQLDFAVTNTVASLKLGGVSYTQGVFNNGTSPSFIAGPGSLLVGSASTLPNTPTNITYTISGKNLTISWPSSYLWLPPATHPIGDER